jgi:hypothetical protein
MPKQKPGKSKQDYETPQDLIEAVHERLGIFDFEFDFACSKKNCKAMGGWTKKDDSLSKTATQWARQIRAGRWGWLNPPFSHIRPWAKKCLQAMWKGADIAFLVPAAVGSNWFRDMIWERSGIEVLYLNGRPSFDGKAGYPKDCMLVLFKGSDVDAPFKTDIWTWKESE